MTLQHKAYLWMKKNLSNLQTASWDDSININMAWNTYKVRYHYRTTSGTTTYIDQNSCCETVCSTCVFPLNESISTSCEIVWSNLNVKSANISTIKISILRSGGVCCCSRSTKYTVTIRPFYSDKSNGGVEYKAGVPASYVVKTSGGSQFRSVTMTGSGAQTLRVDALSFPLAVPLVATPSIFVCGKYPSSK